EPRTDALHSPSGRAAVLLGRVTAALHQALQGSMRNSVRYEYATGTTSRVSNRHSVWPPMMVTAIDARCSEPAPSPIATGIRPAIIETVVIRIGRRRTRFASIIACSAGIPSATRRLV